VNLGAGSSAPAEIAQSDFARPPRRVGDFIERRLGAVANASIYGRVQTIFPIARGLADAGGGRQRQEAVCGPALAKAARRAIVEATFRRRRRARRATTAGRSTMDATAQLAPPLVGAPINLRVYLELRRPNPNGPKIGALMSRYFYVAAIQGTLQVLIIVVMARFATGI
jgi:hypothetical protein